MVGVYGGERLTIARRREPLAYRGRVSEPCLVRMLQW